MTERALRTCEECGSSYFADTSRMAGLCPECAHWLYGHAACGHNFVKGRCARCHWDGSVTEFIAQLSDRKAP